VFRQSIKRDGSQSGRKTMHKHIPFKAQLHNGRIILSGDLDGSREVRLECERIAKLAAQTGSNFVVDAQSARLSVGGEDAWSELALDHLGHCSLIYLPSPLSQNLEYDTLYQHGKSRFLETDDEIFGCSDSSCSGYRETSARLVVAAH